MKHLAPILLSSLIHLSSSLSAAEVVVYSQPSASPLRVAEVTAATNAVAKFGEPSAFPASYTGHRSVCRVAFDETNVVAWAGGGEYRVGDPFGCSTGRGYGAVELTPISPITPRIDLYGGSSDRPRTVKEIYDDIRAKAYADYKTPIALSNRLAQLSWMDTNRIEEPTASQGEDVRVRVVRWLVDGWPLWYLGIEPRVIVDKKFRYRAGAALTEADILADGALDLDWEHLQNEVMDSIGVSDEGLDVNEVDYLVVIGDGVTSWRDGNDSNVVVKALSQVVSRTYDTVPPTPVAVPFVQGVPLSRPQFMFKVPVRFDRNGYTAFELAVLSGTNRVWSSGVRRIPPRDADGRYVFPCPSLDDTVSPGSYTWKVRVYNSKFNPRFAAIVIPWSEESPVTFTED